jgi:hypothetical protein
MHAIFHLDEFLPQYYEDIHKPYLDIKLDGRDFRIVLHKWENDLKVQCRSRSDYECYSIENGNHNSVKPVGIKRKSVTRTQLQHYRSHPFLWVR